MSTIAVEGAPSARRIHSEVRHLYLCTKIVAGALKIGLIGALQVDNKVKSAWSVFNDKI